jgi:hypothetical protein
MDESFAAAAEPLAMQMVLPTTALLEASRLDDERILQSDAVDATAKHAGGDVPLLGRLVWSDKDLGWVADWQLAGESWQVRGVGFDEAFRVAMRGAARILSGNGQP